MKIERLITVYASLDRLEMLTLRHGTAVSAYRSEKCKRMKSPLDRDRGLLAEYCLIEALTRYGAVPTLPLAIDIGAHGKPFLQDGPCISLSHAGDYACAAVCDLSVGVDIERTRPITQSLARRICNDREWNKLWLPMPTNETFRNLFSAKECIVKRSGDGLCALKQADVTTAGVRQMTFDDYVLSVCAEATREWEVYRCE